MEDEPLKKLAERVEQAFPLDEEDEYVATNVWHFLNERPVLKLGVSSEVLGPS